MMQRTKNKQGLLKKALNSTMWKGLKIKLQIMAVVIIYFLLNVYHMPNMV